MMNKIKISSFVMTSNDFFDDTKVDFDELPRSADGQADWHPQPQEHLLGGGGKRDASSSGSGKMETRSPALPDPKVGIGNIRQELAALSDEKSDGTSSPHVDREEVNRLELVVQQRERAEVEKAWNAFREKYPQEDKQDANALKSFSKESPYEAQLLIQYGTPQTDNAAEPFKPLPGITEFENRMNEEAEKNLQSKSPEFRQSLKHKAQRRVAMREYPTPEERKLDQEIAEAMLEVNHTDPRMIEVDRQLKEGTITHQQMEFVLLNIMQRKHAGTEIGKKFDARMAFLGDANAKERFTFARAISEERGVNGIIGSIEHEDERTDKQIMMDTLLNGKHLFTSIHDSGKKIADDQDVEHPYERGFMQYILSRSKELIHKDPSLRKMSDDMRDGVIDQQTFLTSLTDKVYKELTDEDPHRANLYNDVTTGVKSAVDSTMPSEQNSYKKELDAAKEYAKKNNIEDPQQIAFFAYTMKQGQEVMAENVEIQQAVEQYKSNQITKDNLSDMVIKRLSTDLGGKPEYSTIIKGHMKNLVGNLV